MDPYTPDKLRKDFVIPLTEIAGEIANAAKDLERLFAEGRLPHNYLPLNEVMALRAIGELRKFLRLEVLGKLDGAREGYLRYRDYERRFAEKEQQDAGNK